ncbi:MAG: hypothetical protein L3K09_02970 [Thermoplasmata archaeon]|nr:hypothetical protein [Thermoplasmata archaeon]
MTEKSERLCPRCGHLVALHLPAAQGAQGYPSPGPTGRLSCSQMLPLTLGGERPCDCPLVEPAAPSKA